MTKLTICGIYELPSVLKAESPDLVISITDPIAGPMPNLMPANFEGKWLHLGFHDLEKIIEDYTAPSMQHARKLEAFLDAEFATAPEHILVHCHLGASRSPAMAALALALLYSRSEEPSAQMADRIVYQVFEAAPHAHPNTRIIQIAERMMKGFGRSLSSAISSAREAADARSSRSPFVW